MTGKYKINISLHPCKIHFPFFNKSFLKMFLSPESTQHNEYPTSVHISYTDWKIYELGMIKIPGYPFINGYPGTNSVPGYPFRCEKW